jgi:hypothetical protein
MSYHLTRLRLTQTSYSIITLVNSSPHSAYEGVLAIDEEFKKIEASVRPLYFPASMLLDKMN